jgi:hypothetical protein
MSAAFSCIVRRMLQSLRYDEPVYAARLIFGQLAGAPEIWIVGNHYVTAVLADKPAGPLHHQPEVITRNAVWTVLYLFIHHATPLKI